MSNNPNTQLNENQTAVFARVSFIIEYMSANPGHMKSKQTPELNRILMEEIKKKFDIVISVRTIQRYVQKAKIEIRKVINTNFEEKLGLHLIQLDNMLKRVRETGNINMEHNIMKDIAKLQGMYPGQESNFDSFSDVTSEDIKSMNKSQLERIVAGENPRYVKYHP